MKIAKREVRSFGLSVEIDTGQRTSPRARYSSMMESKPIGVFMIRTVRSFGH